MIVKQRVDTIRRGGCTRFGVRAVVCALMLGLAGVACAQVSSYGDKEEGQNRGDELPTVLQRVGVAQHLNAQLPLDAQFVDETGKPVTLGTYFNGKRPALLSLVYFCLLYTSPCPRDR